ncbi:hypothetical protein HYQ46_005416 [Verticillium longisporum]|nr:hypothetical protein HYQ46_005416 [Verticillium longisporum]
MLPLGGGGTADTRPDLCFNEGDRGVPKRWGPFSEKIVMKSIVQNQCHDVLGRSVSMGRNSTRVSWGGDIHIQARHATINISWV